jgi:TonB-linked SusC/RagA family outer membrane protein
MKKNDHCRIPVLFGVRRKWLLVMKIFVVLFLAFNLSLSASVLSQTRVSLNLKNASFIELIQELESKTDLGFIYNQNDIKNIDVISLDTEDISVEEVLDAALEDTGLEYEIDRDIIIIRPAKVIESQNEVQEKKEIKGKVTDDQGIPLPGVSVVIKGTNIGVATDIDGEYVLEFDQENVVLVFSFVGLLSQEIAYKGQSKINVTLLSDSKQMEEVVITGYTKTSKARAVSASSKITVESIDRQVSADLTEQLEGLSTGLYINSVTRDGGQENLEIVLRGISTFDEEGETADPLMQARNSLNRQPLIVIDGFPYEGPFNDIDQSTIQSIDILKDAAATVLWGLRASNGVIVITTKRGTVGNTRVSISSDWAFGTEQDLSDLNLASSRDIINIRKNYMNLFPTSNLPYRVINNEYYDFWQREMVTDYNMKYAALDRFDQIWAGFYDQQITAEERDQQLDALGENDVLDDFQKHLLQKGFTMRNSVSVSSGSEKMNYRLTTSHTKEEKPNKGDGAERLNVSLTTDLQISKRLKTTVDFSLSSSESKLNAIGTQALFTGTVINRFDRLVDDNGNPLAIKGLYEPYKEEFLTSGFQEYEYNPIHELGYKDYVTKNNNIRLAFGLNYKITNWLSADVKYQYNQIETKRLNESKAESFLMAGRNNQSITKISDGYTDVERAIPYGGWLERNVNNGVNQVYRGVLDAYKVIADKHTVKGIVGMEASENSFINDTQRFVGYNSKTTMYDVQFDHYQFDRNMIPSVLGGRYNPINVFTPKTINRTVSTFSNLGYSYDAKYNIEGSLKIDQASAFGINKKLAKNYYWAIAGSWNIGKEEFLKWKPLTALKLRGSFGYNGNMRRGLTSVTTIITEPWDGITRKSYMTINSPGMPNLSPEKTKTINVGLDLTLFNRLNATIDLYDKQSEDLLIFQHANKTYGLDRLYANDGQISNKGIEIHIGGRVLNTRTIKWDVDLNVSHNINKVLQYGERNIVLAKEYLYAVDGGSVKLIDEDVSSKVRYKWAGLDSNGDPQVYNKEGEVIAWNSPEFEKLTSDDLVKTKPFMAPTFGGLTNRFSYKNFSLSTMMTFKFGHVFEESLDAKYPYKSDPFSQKYHKDVANAWQEPGDELVTNIPAAPRNSDETYYLRGQAFTKSDYGIQDASYIRLKDITLNYRFDKSLLKKIGVRSASLQFQVRNLGLIWSANDKGIDPESVPFMGRSISHSGTFSSGYRPGIRVPVSYAIGARIEF